MLASKVKALHRHSHSAETHCAERGLDVSNQASQGVSIASVPFGPSLGTGLKPHRRFNMSRFVFAVQPDRNNVDTNVRRFALELRPLGLKNSDNKIGDSAVNYSFKRELSSKLHFSPMGFSMQRQFLSNILEADVWARIYGRACCRDLMPLLILLDFCASVSDAGASVAYVGHQHHS